MAEAAQDWITAGEILRSLACQPNTPSDNVEDNADAHLLHTIRVTPEQSNLMLTLSDWSETAQPDMHPILTVPTSWYTASMQRLTVSALIDTG